MTNWRLSRPRRYRQCRRALLAIVYFHGGGWVIANLDTYAASARALTNSAQAVVVSVAYRRAPEYAFPAPVEDAYAATQWVMQNAADIGGDPSRVAVAGESAGGNMATVVTMMARDRVGMMPVYQLLVYPVTQLVDFDTPSYQQNANAVPLNRELMMWFADHYVPNQADGSNPYASPLLAEDLSGLPPATVITAEIDPPRSEGEAYANRLSEAGVEIVYEDFDGVAHEFFGMTAVLEEARQAVALAAQGLQSGFAMRDQGGTMATAEATDTMMAAGEMMTTGAGTVSASHVNVRTDPDTNSPTAGSLTEGLP